MIFDDMDPCLVHSEFGATHQAFCQIPRWRLAAPVLRCCMVTLLMSIFLGKEIEKELI